MSTESEAVVNEIDEGVHHGAGSDGQEVQPKTEAGPSVEEKYNNLQAALREERGRRKELTEKTKRMEDAYERIMARISAQQEPEKKAPDPESDPVGFIVHSQDDLRRRLEGAERQAQIAEQERRHGENIGRLMDDYRAHAAEFMKQEPGFGAAYNALVRARVDEYMEAGYNATEAAQAAQNEELTIAARAIRSGDNPARIMFNLAKKRGLVAKPQPGQSSAETILDAAGRASPIAGARSDGPAGKMTLEQLANLEGEDFDKAWAKMMR